jgi:hypothetical protein
MDQRSQPFAPGPSSLAGSTVLALLVLPFAGVVSRRKRRRSMVVVLLVAASSLLLATLATGCGNRVNTAPESVNASSYTLTVTGTATSPAGTAVQHSANVTLQVL